MTETVLLNGSKPRSPTTATLQAIKYSRGSLAIIDQLALPHTTRYLDIDSTSSAWKAIKAMNVRGAPAIAIVAALSLAVEICAKLENSGVILQMSPEDLVDYCKERLQYLVTSRPTAVNLSDAADKLGKILDECVGEDSRTFKATTSIMVREAYVKAAEQMLGDDVRDNENIGRYGAEWVMANATIGDDGKTAILTHCNTGSLATAGYGTALGVIRALHAAGQLSHAYCTETRPYNQGSRLTAYELVYEKIPATLIADSMASALLQLGNQPMEQKGSRNEGHHHSYSRGPHNVGAIVVGADRVVRNGDTANKIGTYQLAIVARHHGVKFVVAAPTTSLDMAITDGHGIVIENRAAEELVTLAGPVVTEDEFSTTAFIKIRTAAPGIEVFNPAFDVTPHELIDAIITEKGAVEKDADGKFPLEGLFAG